MSIGEMAEEALREAEYEPDEYEPGDELYDDDGVPVSIVVEED